MHGMKRGAKSPLSNQVPPSNLGAPSNSGLERPHPPPLSATQYHSLQKV